MTAKRPKAIMTKNPTGRRRQKTRLLFIQAFLRLIAVRDFEEITVTEIANEASYGRWIFYQYFHNKEDIAYAAFAQWMTQLDALVIDSVQGLDSPLREYRSLRILFGEFAKQKWFFRRMADSMTSSGRSQVRELLTEQFRGHLRAQRFSLMLPSVEPEIGARLYVVCGMEVLEYWLLHPEPIEMREVVDQFFTFIFRLPPPE